MDRKGNAGVALGELVPLRVLLLEDSARDAELTVRELRKAGYDLEWTRVDSEEDFREEILSHPDLIIADFTLPQFDGISAAQILRRAELATPFIIVSGTITEEAAVAAMRAGADDYLLKDRLARLGPAVRNALEQRRLRTEEQRAQLSLLQSEARYRRLLTSMSALVVEVDISGTVLYVNETVPAVTGYTIDEVIGRNGLDLLFPGDTRKQLESAAIAFARGEDLRNYVTRVRTKHGAPLVLEWNTANQYDESGSLRKVVALGMDVTAREAASARIHKLSRLYAAISEANAALVRSRTTDELFTAVCTACVNHGDFKLAWVGLVDTERRLIAAKACGPAIGYLEGIVISIDADLPEGRGIAGSAYRERRIHICNDMANDPISTPWQERAAAHGLAACIALPLSRGDEVVGVLSAYAGESGVFDEETVTLLDKMAENVSVALDQFQREEQRAELSREVVRIQEDERRRLARELHDRTSPNLSAVSLNLSMIATELPADAGGELEARLADTDALLEDTIAGIREISAELHPAALEHAGLAPALRGYAVQFARRTGIDVVLPDESFEARLPADKETALFRIAQEALTNCAKHSRAKTIVMNFAREEERVVMSIADDGVGFDPSLLGKEGHTPGLGLLTMRERTEFAGGELDVAAAPGKGVRILVRM